MAVIMPRNRSLRSLNTVVRPKMKIIRFSVIQDPSKPADSAQTEEQLHLRMN